MSGLTPALGLTDKALMAAFNAPIAFFQTFRTYGTWLPGDERGSVDREHNIYGTPFLPADAGKVQHFEAKLNEEPLELDAAMRAAVEAGIRELCGSRGWPIHAMNVRTNHVHVALSSKMSPSRTMSQLKAFATKELRARKLVSGRTKVWSRGGSVKWLFTEEHLNQARHYITNGQGPDLPGA